MATVTPVGVFSRAVLTYGKGVDPGGAGNEGAAAGSRPRISGREPATRTVEAACLAHWDRRRLARRGRRVL